MCARRLQESDKQPTTTRHVSTVWTKKPNGGRGRHEGNRVKVCGLSARDALEKAHLTRSSILAGNCITATTFLQAWLSVESLTTKQLQRLKQLGPSKKRSNTSFRIHALDRHLQNFLTADLPIQRVGFPEPGRLRLLFEIKKGSAIKCIGLIDNHHAATPLAGGQTIQVAGKTWPGVSIAQLLGANATRPIP